LLHGQVGRLGAFENPVHIGCTVAGIFRIITNLDFLRGFHLGLKETGYEGENVSIVYRIGAVATELAQPPLDRAGGADGGDGVGIIVAAREGDQFRMPSLV
jgi:hypothetical protein